MNENKTIYDSEMSFTVYAGTWRSDANGWWYQNDDGSYPAGKWEWIDGNGDGVAECYCFFDNGYMAWNNDIEGYHVDENGCWTVNGTVETRTLPNSNMNRTGRDIVRLLRWTKIDM